LSAGQYFEVKCADISPAEFGDKMKSFESGATLSAKGKTLKSKFRII
jgi:hypothetical protein